jgi:hypothetical protein
MSVRVPPVPGPAQASRWGGAGALFGEVSEEAHDPILAVHRHRFLFYLQV